MQLGLNMLGPEVQAADNTRQILSLNGVDQYLKLAKTVVGVGQGTIKIVCKLSDVGSNFYLFDNSENANRFYCYIEHSTGIVHKPGGVAASVNGVTAAVVNYGELIEIELSGDFTGLVIGQLFIRFDEVEAAQPQVFSISYEDEAQSFAYDFNVAQNYFLPVGADRGRNLWIDGLIAVPANTGVWSTLAGTTTYLDAAHVGKVVEVVYKSKSDVNTYLYLGTFTDADKRSIPAGGSGSYATILTGQEIKVVTRSDIPATDGSLEIEVREIPNALILQSPSANIADDFEPMVQRGDGHWEGSNVWDWDLTTGSDDRVVVDGKSGLFNIDGTDSGEIRSAGVLEIGESYFYGAVITDYISGRIAMSSSSWILHDADQGTIDGYVPSVTTDRAAFSRSGADCKYRVVKPYYKRAIKLSDHLQKQFIIEQTKAAVAAYQAKKKTRNVTTGDGVDDHVQGLDITLAGDFDIYGWFYVSEVPTINKALMGGDGGASPLPDAFTLYLNNTGRLSVQFPRTTSSLYKAWDFEVGAVNKYHLKLRGGELSLTVGSETISDFHGDLVPIRITRLNGWSGGLDFDGQHLGCVIIDHENPLPIGRGGSSGFWPLDDPKGTVAANKLGLDSKGNVVVKDSAAQLTVYDKAVSFAHTDGAWHIKEQEVDVFEAGKTYLVYLDARELDAGYIQLNNVDGTDRNGQWRPQCPAGEDVYYHWRPVTTGDVSIQKSNVPAAGKVSAKIVSLVAAGEWQGLPSDFSSTELVSRDAEGAYIGENKSIISEVVTSEGGNGRTNIDFYEVVPDGILRPNTLHRFSLDVEDYEGNGTVGFATSNGIVWGNGNFVDGNGSIEVIDKTTSTGRVRLFNSAGCGCTFKSIEVAEFAPLSAELQRQHDLAIVETSVGKLLKKAEKAVNLAEFDGVDDETAFPVWVANGRFKLGFSFVTDLAGTVVVLGSSVDYSNHLFVGPTQVQLRIGTTRMYFDGVFNDGFYHTGMFERESDGSVFLVIDGDTRIPENTGLKVIHPLVLDRFATEATVTPSNFKSGYALLLDIEDPSNSRFYVHNPLGYLEDKLHSDGSMNGTYSGMPVDFSNIKAFKKSGDDWISVDQLTTIKGA